MTSYQTSRLRHLSTHWPKSEADALEGTIPNRPAEVKMHTIGDTLGKVLLG